jgi:hypothetical protein
MERQSGLEVGAYDIEYHFQQYFRYIVTVSFISDGNKSTQIKPLTCWKLLTNFITWCCIGYTLPWTGFKLTTLVVKGSNCIGSCKCNYHTITTSTAPRVDLNLWYSRNWLLSIYFYSLNTNFQWYRWHHQITKFSATRKTNQKMENFGCFLFGCMCLISVCVILALSQIYVFNFGTLRNRWCSHFVDNPFIEKILFLLY